MINTLYDINNSTSGVLVIFATHNTFSSEDFISRMKGLIAFPRMLIVDEVHATGAKERRLGLLDEYDIRLGLSATPIRYMDEGGTDFLINYFHGVVYSLSMEEAIKKGIWQNINIGHGLQNLQMKRKKNIIF